MRGEVLQYVQDVLRPVSGGASVTPSEFSVQVRNNHAAVVPVDHGPSASPTTINVGLRSSVII